MHDGLRRAVALLVLVVVFFGVMFHYAAVAPQQELVQQSVTKLQSPDEHAGETVHVWARVVRNDDVLVVDDIGGRDDFELTVVGAETDAQPDDAIQVYGTIRPDGTVAAERVVVSERTSLRQLYAVSVGALALTVVVFFRSWSVDPEHLAFVPREDREDA